MMFYYQNCKGRDGKFDDFVNTTRNFKARSISKLALVSRFRNVS